MEPNKSPALALISVRNEVNPPELAPEQTQP